MPGPNRHTEGIFEIADVVATTAATNGEIRANVGDATLGTGIDSGVPFWGTDGFLGRPADPTSAGAAQFLFFVDGNQRYGIGSRDRRFLSEAGTLDPGDRVIYTKSGTRVFLDESESTITATTSGGATFTLSDDEFTITLPGGASLTLTNLGFEVNVPTTPLPSYFTIDALGATVSTPNLTQGAYLDAGLVVSLGLNTGGVRPIIPTVANVIVGPFGVSGIPSPRVYAANV
jgi:hypothetical protein